MIKYKAHHLFLQITEHDCVAETEQTVTVIENGKPRKRGKITTYDSFHNIFEDAVNFLMVMEHKKLSDTLGKAQYHRDRISEINKLKDPATLKAGEQLIPGADLS